MNKKNLVQNSMVDSKNLLDVIKENMKKFPDKEAVVFDEYSISYLQLETKSNEVAYSLIRHGCRKGDYIITRIDSSPELVPILIGILKAGAIYVPTDAGTPLSRINFIADETNTKFVIISNSVDSNGIKVTNILSVDDLITGESNQTGLKKDIKLDDIMYVLYTSGTTGSPKGVKVKYEGIINLFSWMKQEFLMDSNARVLKKAAITFDASIWEIFFPLFLGGTVVLADSQTYRNPKKLCEILKNQRITSLLMVPTMLRYLLEEQGITECYTIKNFFCGGEALSKELLSLFFEKFSIPLTNLYGPTETTIIASSWTFTEYQASGIIPIGKPISNVKFYILNEEGEKVSKGQVGELYIEGSALAQGYVANRKENEKRFLKNPYNNKKIFYRTGDLVSEYQNGIYEYHGRIDDQVKINGYRIETKEIEQTIVRHSCIKNAAILVDNVNLAGNQLIAYIEITDTIALSKLRTYLKEYLPEYMIPVQFRIIKEFPISNNDKLDRKKIPLLDSKLLSDEYVSSVEMNKGEAEILSLWLKLLNRTTIGLDDDFFEIGGNSILAIQFIANCDEKKIEITLDDMFLLRTIRKLVNKI